MEAMRLQLEIEEEEEKKKNDALKKKQEDDSRRRAADKQKVSPNLLLRVFIPRIHVGISLIVKNKNSLNLDYCFDCIVSFNYIINSIT